MNTKAMLLEKIEVNHTKDAYDAAKDICYFKQLKAQAVEDMETEKRAGNMERYERRKSAAAACDRAINKAMRRIKGARLAKNKAGAPGLKTKDSGFLIRAE